MGKTGSEIISVDKEALLQKLNALLADEWLAHYNYWVAALVASGPMRGAIVHELEEHAKEEREHADKVAARILELGGEPVGHPDEWSKLAPCKYPAPPADVKGILTAAIAGERCAIKGYQELAEMTHGKDHLTYALAIDILADEVEHEEDLEAFQEDMAGL